MTIIKKRELWLKPVPADVTTTKVTVPFKIAEADSAKPLNDVIRVDEDGTIIYISSNSFFNGLIMGDKLLKVNDCTGKKCVAELSKGQCTVEVMRRKGALPVTPERLHKSCGTAKRGHACFILEVKRPPNMTTTSVGLKLGVMKRRAFVTQTEPNTISTTFFGRGDSIVDIEGVPIPFTDNADNFIREKLSKLSTGSQVSFLVERPITLELAKELQKFIESITFDNSDVEMAKDVIEIGREASNMHFIVLKKLITPSILTSDVNKRKKKNNKQTSDVYETNISISTASTEMKITSDVADSEELKPVIPKSHAAGHSDNSGAFDDE